MRSNTYTYHEYVIRLTVLPIHKKGLRRSFDSLTDSPMMKTLVPPNNPTILQIYKLSGFVSYVL